MEIIELSFFLLLATAFTMLVAFCVIAVIIAILIGLDQIIKYWALNSLKEVNSIPVINNIFSLTYVENRGNIS